MKKWLGFLVLFCIPFVMASVPSFDIYSGYVFCGGSSDYLSTYILEVNVSSAEDKFIIVENVVGGIYNVVIDANENYTNSFYVNQVFVDSYNYSAYNFSEINFTLSSNHSLCSDGGDPGGSPGGSSNNDENITNGTDNIIDNTEDLLEGVLDDNQTSNNTIHEEEPTSSSSVGKFILFGLIFFMLIGFGYYIYKKKISEGVQDEY